MNHSSVLFGKRMALTRLVLGFAVLGTVSLWSLVSQAGIQGGTGPDVTVFGLNGVLNYGASGGVRAYSIGTTSCNVGTAPLWWCDDPGDSFCNANQHPVIAQNIYRLKDERFEQIGMGWLKHGFLSLNSSSAECGNGICVQPPHNSDQLGVGCTNSYSSSANGARPLGMRSEVNPTNGDFPFPYTEVGASTVVDQRVQVAETDLDPALNPGALYWIEGHYIASDDAESSNGRNNASHRAVTVSGPNFNLSVAGPTVRQQPAIFAWAAAVPSTEIVVVEVGEMPAQYFHVGRNVSPTPEGGWHYEYAVHNLNAARAARGFSVQFPGAASITNVGMHDVKHHSGEPYAATDWTTTVDGSGGQVSWSTSTFAVDPNANALRWGTMFSFWFDSDTAPRDAVQTLELFTPGVPSSVVVEHADLFFQDGFETGDQSGWDAPLP